MGNREWLHSPFPNSPFPSSPLSRSVKIIGWSTIGISALIICTDLFTLVLTSTVDQLGVVLNAFPDLRSGTMSAMSDFLAYNRYWTFYSILYFAVVLWGAILFLRFRERGRMIMEIACWVGILNACVDTVSSYTLWQSMNRMLSGLSGGVGMSLGQLNPIGLVGIAGGFVLWVIPSVGMIVYLRRPTLKSLMQ